MSGENLPRHVGVIMDGNGRWAEKRGFPRERGHFAGASKVFLVASYLFARGVRYVSLYAFSTENFSRPQTEVQGIFDRITEFAESFPKKCEGKIKLVFSGERTGLSDELRSAIALAEKETQTNEPFTLNILLNYGGREEILRAARLFYGDGDEAEFRKGLYNDLPDLDLIIRTGGERRLSGFMPFQSVYAELYFTNVLFPDIEEDDVELALEDYSRRKRRFGGI